MLGHDLSWLNKFIHWHTTNAKVVASGATMNLSGYELVGTIYPEKSIMHHMNSINSATDSSISMAVNMRYFGISVTLRTGSTGMKASAAYPPRFAAQLARSHLAFMVMAPNLSIYLYAF